MAAEAAHILKKKESILCLEKYLGQNVLVVLSDDGNRRLEGILRGFDSNVNLVLSGAVQIKGKLSRSIGTTIVRGGSVLSVMGVAKEIEDPYT